MTALTFVQKVRKRSLVLQNLERFFHLNICCVNESNAGQMSIQTSVLTSGAFYLMNKAQ